MQVWIINKKVRFIYKWEYGLNINIKTSRKEYLSESLTYVKSGVFLDLDGNTFPPLTYLILVV